MGYARALRRRTTTPVSPRRHGRRYEVPQRDYKSAAAGEEAQERLDDLAETRRRTEETSSLDDVTRNMG